MAFLGLPLSFRCPVFIPYNNVYTASYWMAYIFCPIIGRVSSSKFSLRIANACPNVNFDRYLHKLMFILGGGAVASVGHL